MWTCSYCGKTFNEMPEAMKCSGCGFTLGRAKATRAKLQILKDICELNGYDLFIDGCSGSGKVQLHNGDIINGSALLFEETARKKSPPAGRVFIEVDPKTFGLLKRFCENSNAKLINDDCNQHLLKLVNGQNRTLVFIDPFGYGIPAIRKDIVIRLSETPNTDLLINFTWRIAREMGYARTYLYCTIDHCPSPTRAGERFGSCSLCPNRQTAISYASSATMWWGHEDWLKWGSLTVREYAERYASPLRKHGKVEIYRIPQHSKDPTYQLIFATKFETPKYGILKWLE